MKNTIVGWIALLGLLFVGLMVIVAIATVLDQGGHATVTCNSTETSVTCVRS